MPRGRRNGQPQALREVLENYTVPNLKALAQVLKEGVPTRKADLVALIVRHLEDADHLRRLWDAMDKLQQAAVSEVVHSPSEVFDANGFRAKYGRDPDFGSRQWGDIKDASLLCLFIYNGRIPGDLKQRLRAFVPPPRASEIKTVESLPSTVRQSHFDYDSRQKVTEEVPLTVCEMERVAQHDLQAVLRLIDAGKVSVSAKTNRVSAAGARAVAEVLQGGDFYDLEETLDSWGDEKIGPIKAFAWPLIVQAAGLAELAGTKLQLTTAGKRALTSAPHTVINRAWKRWLKTTLLDEFNRVHTIKGQTGKGKRQMTAPSSRRAVLVDALAACPPYQWIAFDEFSRIMRAAGHTFEVARDLWPLYISDANYGSLGYSGFGEWHVVQARYILTFLMEYAATLGLIDVAYIDPAGARPDYGNLWGVDDLGCLSRYDGLLYLRINGLGAWCLGITEDYASPPVIERPVLTVLPNMEIVATEPLSPVDVLFLEQIAEQKADFVWQLERVKLLEAVEQGHALPGIVAFLEAKSSNTLPDNVVIFLKETAERAVRLVERGPALLIEAQDTLLAQLIANDSRTRSLCMLAGERHLVVPVENERAFRRSLRELGYGLPKGT
jgi:hypothetical protein